MSRLSRLVDWYFQPKDFERSGRLYEMLGVRQFQKLYFHTVGFPFHSIEWLSDFSEKSLLKMEKWTHLPEAAHFIGNVLMTGLIAASIINKDYRTMSFDIGVNLAINVYPILLQRYNRARIYNILDHRKSIKNRN